jgi:serine protease Do
MRRISLFLCLCLLLCSCGQRGSSPRRGGGSESRSLPTGPATGGGAILSYADVVDRVAPAVVTIRATARVRAPQQFPFFDDPFFQQFFGGRIPRGGGETQSRESLGSGVIVRDDGYIVTNHHVVDGAEQIKVDLNNRPGYPARLVGSDPLSDLAVLKIGASGLPVLYLGDSDKVRVGDVVLAVGNPLNIGETVTAGIISAKERRTGLSNGSFQDFLQTDAPINRGNSGGALVNTRGELIGINSQIVSPSPEGGNIGIGFAIPSNMTRTVVNDLIGKGKVQRGMMGVNVQPMNDDLAQMFEMPKARGVVISGVNPGSAAERAGLKQGDVVLRMNGKDVSDTNSFRNDVAAMGPNAEVTLTIWRNKAEQQVKVRLGEWTASAGEQRSGGGSGGAEAGGRLGITVETLTPELAAQFGLRRGVQGVVVTEVAASGPAADAGIRPGDVIQEVNRQPVRTPADVRSALRKNATTPVLLVIRGGQGVYIPVPLR